MQIISVIIDCLSKVLIICDGAILRWIRLKQSRVDQSLNLDATMMSRGSIKNT